MKYGLVNHRSYHPFRLTSASCKARQHRPKIYTPHQVSSSCTPRRTFQTSFWRFNHSPLLAVSLLASFSKLASYPHQQSFPSLRHFFFLSPDGWHICRRLRMPQPGAGLCSSYSLWIPNMAQMAHLNVEDLLFPKCFHRRWSQSWEEGSTGFSPLLLRSQDFQPF